MVKEPQSMNEDIRCKRERAKLSYDLLEHDIDLASIIRTRYSIDQAEPVTPAINYVARFNIPLTQYKLKKVSGSYTSTITAGNSVDFYDIQPDDGFIQRILGLRLSVDAPAGAGSGVHRFHIYWQDSYDGIYVSAAYNENLYLYPSSSALVYTCICNPMFFATKDVPIHVYYINATDANQTNNITYYLTVSEEIML